MFWVRSRPFLQKGPKVAKFESPTTV